MDNAKHNDTFMEELQKLLDAQDIAFDAVDRRIMCYGHIVDLTSGRVIRGVSADTKTTRIGLDLLCQTSPPAKPTNKPSNATLLHSVVQSSG